MHAISRFLPRIRTLQWLVAMGLVACMQTTALAKDDYQSLSLTAATGVHSANSSKDNQSSLAIQYQTAHLEQYGYALNGQFMTAPYSEGGSLKQFQVDGHFWQLYTPDHFFAQIRLKGDLYALSNNDTVANTDEVTAGTMSAELTSLNERYAVTPAFSYSQYPGLAVSQYDLLLSLRVNDLWDHLEYQPSWIQLSEAVDGNKTQYLTHRVALTHYMSRFSNVAGLKSIGIFATTGDRPFMVDTATWSLYNTPDIPNDSAGVSFTFQPNRSFQWIIGGGYEGFRTVEEAARYSLVYGFVQIRRDW